MELNAEQQAQLISKLIPTLEGQFAAPVTKIETHISTVLLVADKAFKIKKPVNFGFLDFSSLEKRRFYCNEELRLNSRFAPRLYETVLPITGSTETPAINGDSAPIEYMIQMQRFEQQNELDHLLENNQLKQEHIDQLADIIADFHHSILTADSSKDYVQPGQVQFAIQENFDQIRPLHGKLPAEVIQQIATLENWSQQQFKTLKETFKQRLHDGFVRECHGDMHLGNITLIDNEITIFDGIEFNNEFRWIDIISDLAFLLMDLHFEEKPAYAFRLLNRYLESTGDYQGVQLLPYYQTYRAMVRAKVAALRLSQLEQSDDEYQNLKNNFIRHVELAEQLSSNTCQFLMITHGVSGSGKSYASQQVIENFGAIRIRSDVERIRMYPDSQTRYTSEATDKVYAQLLSLAKIVINSGYSAVLDATYLKIGQRNAVHQRAKELECPFVILDMQCEVEELERRINKRLADNKDASEASVEILHKQLASEESLMTEELQNSVAISSSNLINDRLGRFLDNDNQ